MEPVHAIKVVPFAFFINRHPSWEIDEVLWLSDGSFHDNHDDRAQIQITVIMILVHEPIEIYSTLHKVGANLFGVNIYEKENQEPGFKSRSSIDRLNQYCLSIQKLCLLIPSAKTPSVTPRTQKD